MKKKYGLFKVLSVLLLIIVVLTYFIDSRQGGKSYLALVDVVLNFMQSFYSFFENILFVLVVGGFYGILNRIPAYKQMVKGIVDKVQSKSKLFVIITTVVLALVSAFTGLNVLLLLFVPMIVSVILLLGYDKLVALSATVGSIVIGLIGGVFLTVRDPYSGYGVSFTTIDKLVGLDSHWSNLLPKFLLLILGIVLLVWYILSHIKNVEYGKCSYALTKSDSLFVELRDKNGKKVEVTSEKKVMVWPLAVCMGLVFGILVLGYLPWKDLFNLEIFEKFHTWLTGLKIGDYSVFTSLISVNFSAFGTWSILRTYLAAIVVLLVFSIILMLIYRIKFDDAMDGFLYGVKKMLPAGLVVILAYTVFLCSYDNGFIETVITLAGEKLGDNAIIHSLLVMFGSVFYVDFYYTSAGIFSNIVPTLSDSANLSVYAAMFQSLYGLVQIVGPTSILLLVGLSYLEVPYKTWLKYIWRFVVGLLIIIFIVLMITSLL